ncbi:MAG: PEP-CTERM sorting domain-containing protein [Actinobacteria bacterium]|nr:PEP-CTERM sorting domain-containing protein [Actinomycetota bacterium]
MDAVAAAAKAPTIGRRLLLGAASALLIAAPAQATIVNQSFNFSGFTLPDDDTGFEPDVTFTFIFDDACSSNCTLRIDLTYNESGDMNGGQQALTGVTFDPVGSITADPANSTALAPTLVGSQSATAIAELSNTTIDGLSGEIVSGHWAFRDDLENGLDPNVPVAFDDLGNYAFFSVGDVTFGGVKLDVFGMEHLLTGTISSVETNPPDGIPFGIVDPDTTDLAGILDTTLAQSLTTLFLDYDGTLDGIENVRPHFGTDGVVPEPATAALLGLGLFGLGIAGRRRR